MLKNILLFYFLLLLFIFSGCVAKQSAIVMVKGEPLSNYQSLFSINFYPNPIKDTLNVSFNSPVCTKGAIKIYDMFGNEAKQLNMEVKEGLNSICLPLDTIAEGVYLVEAYAGNKQLGIKRINKE